MSPVDLGALSYPLAPKTLTMPHLSRSNLSLLAFTALLAAPAANAYQSFYWPEPTPPYSESDWAARDYRRDVEDYVRKAEDFVRQAQDEAEDALRKAQEAQRKANDVIDEYNEWVRRLHR